MNVYKMKSLLGNLLKCVFFLLSVSLASQWLIAECFAKEANTNAPPTNQAAQTPSHSAETTSSQNSSLVEPTPAKSDLGQGSEQTDFINIIVQVFLAIFTAAGGIWAFWTFVSWVRKKKAWFGLRRFAASGRLRLEEKTYIRPLLPAKHENKVIRYGVAVFQDTILPLFFDYVHRQAMERHGLRIEFVQFQWGEGECREKFLNGEIDVALHNLFSVVPHYANSAPNPLEPSIFIPFFDFSGQGIFINKSLLPKLDNHPDLVGYKALLTNTPNGLFDKSLDENRKRLLHTLLSDTTAIVEFGTDLEITLNGLYESAGLLINKREFHKEPFETQEGYQMFIDPNQIGDVFCGGLIHTYKLRQPPYNSQFIHLCTGKGLGVKSANGLVTTSQYAERNPRIVKDLIDVWYWSIQQFKSDVMACTGNNILVCDQHRLDSILAFLGKILETSPVAGVDKEIDVELLKMMFSEGFEEFHEDLRTAVQSFYFSRDQNNLKSLVYVAKNAALSTLPSDLKGNLSNASVDNLVDGIREHHSRILLSIIPEAC